MAGIQTHIKNERGEVEELHVNDPRYWNGPYTYKPYERMLYRASEGRYQDGDLERCVVKNEQEQREREHEGWRAQRDEARKHFDGLEADIARAAAEVKYAARGMSQPAQDELREAEQETDEFVTDVKPKRRGWSAARRAAQTKKEKTDS